MFSLKEKLHHEHWPAPLFYTPVFFYYLYNSLKFRKFNYFTSVNPALDTGGMCGFSKYDSFKLIPSDLLPNTVCLSKRYYSQKELYNLLQENNLRFPLIVKPDQGERGFLVSKVDDLDKLHFYLKNKSQHINFLIQNYIDYPLEVGAFLIYRDKAWHVTSLTSKNFWSVVGDGKKTLKELALEEESGKKLSLQTMDLLKVPAKGKRVILEPIGNHCRGTDFINSCDKISEKMQKMFNEKFGSTEGLRYVRFDLRTPSWEELEKGNFKVMEINGVSSEPGHIYDAKTPLSQAYKDLFSHWSQMAKIADEEIHKKTNQETFSETFKKVISHMGHKKTFKSQFAEKFLHVEGLGKIDFEKPPEKILEDFDGEQLIKKHICFKSENGYERVTLFENEECEIVFCHWHPGNVSPMHFHPNKNCWFKCLSGQIYEERSRAKEKNLIKQGEVGFINDEIDAHQMINSFEESAYTLHIYKSKVQ